MNEQVRMFNEININKYKQRFEGIQKGSKLAPE